jgi:hypothetical protein
MVESGRAAAERARRRIEQAEREQAQLQAEIQAAKDLDLEQLAGDVRTRVDGLGKLAASVEAYIEQVAAARADEGEETRMLAALGTRLVVLVILVFLVQILVNLYRYYVRLSSYYSARADLMLMAPEMDAQTLSLVAATITADVDFQPPTSPNENLVEVLKSVAMRRS